VSDDQQEKLTGEYAEMLAALMLLLQSVDVDSNEAKLNAVSMKDNNGCRILF